MIADLLAQLTMAALMVLAATPQARRLIDDMSDGNVCRLEREEAEAAEARAWLIAMGVWK
jgi:hypothetical protein